MAQSTQRNRNTAAAPSGPPTDPGWDDDQGTGIDIDAPEQEAGLVVTRTDPALVEAELRTFASICRGLTRVPDDALKSALGELELSARMSPGRYDEKKKLWVDGFAASQYYVIDYGGGEKPVTGLAYPASLLLARHWGGLMGTTRIVAETDDYIDAEGMAMQFSPVFVLRRARRESKWIRQRATRKLVRIREDLIPQVHGRAQSKAQRNAFLAVIPHVIQTVYWNRCKELAAGIGRGQPRVDLKKAIQPTLDWLAERGVTRDHVEAKLGHNIESITREEWADLRGVCNAIHGGETTAERAFNIPAAPPADEAIEDDPTVGGTTTD